MDTKMNKLGEWVKYNKTIKFLYDLEFYLTQGKSKVTEYLAFFSYLTILVGGMKYLFNINISRNLVIIMFPLITIGLIVFGWLMVKLKLYHVDIMRNMIKNPVSKEIYYAAIRINKGYDNNGKGKLR